MYTFTIVVHIAKVYIILLPPFTILLSCHIVKCFFLNKNIRYQMPLLECFAYCWTETRDVVT